MSAPAVAVLDQLTPAAEDGWHVLFDLAETDTESWTLIGGQMVYLLAVENGITPPRSTDDVDVVVDIRARRGATEWLADWLVDRGFELASVSADGIGHRFTRAVHTGAGVVVFDILAPDGVGERSTTFTRRPARTVSAPGTTQALGRSETIALQVSGYSGLEVRSGRVRRPTALGALIAKAAATTIAVRQNPERDYEDSALLLCLIGDPIVAREQCSRSDLRNLRRLRPLAEAGHPAWRLLDRRAVERGRDALAFFVD